jgi:hypothetical protein
MPLTSDSPRSITASKTLSVAAVAGTSISGTFAEGSAITISGSGFGSKAVAAPKKYSDFNDGIEDQLIDAFDSEWVSYEGGIVGARMTRKDAYSGNSCVHAKHGDTHAADSDHGGANGHEFDTNYFRFASETGKPVRVVYKHKIVNDSADDNYGIRKLGRIGSSGSGGGGGVYNGAFTARFANNQFDFYNSDGVVKKYDGDNGYISAPGSYEQTWVTIVHIFGPNSEEGVADGIHSLEIIHPSWGYYKVEDPAAEPLVGGSTMYSNSFLLGLMVANSDYNGHSAWHTVYEDNVYIDNDLALVVVTDAPTIGASKFYEVQVCSGWVDEQITVPSCSAGRLSAGTNYIHIINTNGVLVDTTEVTL